jgi:lactoylglutathione lyase
MYGQSALLLSLCLSTSAAFSIYPARVPRRARSSPAAAMSLADEVTKYYKHETDPETKSYVMQQTMVRVKDPVASLKFYCEVLGFHLVMHREYADLVIEPRTSRLASSATHALPPRWDSFPQWGFTVYFVAPVDPATIPTSPEEQWGFCMRTPGCIELTHNYGSEKEEGKARPPRGPRACTSSSFHRRERAAAGVQHGQLRPHRQHGWRKGAGRLRPSGHHRTGRVRGVRALRQDGLRVLQDAQLGRCAARALSVPPPPPARRALSACRPGAGMKGLAFVKDPDGYLVEILPQGPMISKPVDHAGVAAEGGEGYKDNSK